MAVLIRDIFQCKYGQSDRLEELFKQATPWMREHGFTDLLLLEDLSGPFFTIVSEYRVPTLAAWEMIRESLFADQRFGPWFEEMMTVVENGRREFWHIIDEA